MSSTRPCYISSSEGRFSAAFTPRVIGVFSTQALAVASVKKNKPCYVRIPDYFEPRVKRYGDNDCNFKIVPQHGDIVGTSTNSTHTTHTVFLAIDECGNSIVETKRLGTADGAWAACKSMKRRYGSYWKDEREWTDNNGCKHGEAEFNITTSSTPTEVGDNVSQQLAGLRTTGMLKHHWYVKEVVIDEEEER